MLGFKNIDVYVEGKGIITTDIAIENGKISAYSLLSLLSILYERKAENVTRHYAQITAIFQINTALITYAGITTRMPI